MSELVSKKITQYGLQTAAALGLVASAYYLTAALARETEARMAVGVAQIAEQSEEWLAASATYSRASDAFGEAGKLALGFGATAAGGAILMAAATEIRDRRELPHVHSKM